MIDFIEIHNQLKEIRGGKCTHFYGFNEIKNILLEQNNFAQLQAKMEPLFKELTLEEKKAALPLFVTTTSAQINRYAAYEMADLLSSADERISMAILKNLLDPYVTIPEDSFKALRESGYVFHLSLPIIDTLLANSSWDKLAFLSPELKKLSESDKREIKEKLEAILPPQSKTIHGIEIEVFDRQTLFDALK